ncbi:hypothetical protein MFIFM68171_06648 [Madurella fahalii]|uniref:Alpha/beta hydrolase fold-3 domain-containing protein n=1 Tax=Madurella fahalii TaxID=1157608 RepID=A0ABQ0GFA6_9PEZI
MPTTDTPPERSEHAVSLGILGWVRVLSRSTYITSSLLRKAVVAVARGKGKRGGLSLYDYVTFQGMRDYQCGLGAVGIQNLLPATATTCRWFARRHGLPHSKIVLADGTIAVWIGPAEPAKVVVVFHGGGYMAPALPQHVALPFGFAKSPRRDSAVVVLQYDLASENANHYPNQLQQAVSLIDYLLHSRKISASVITLLGDSAGGHLLLGLLLHINHPNPKAPPVNIGGARFSGAALVSPWVELNSTCESLKSNEPKDILSGTALAYWARNLLGDAPLDHWNSPLTAPAAWWADLPVENILVTYGEDELFCDDVARLCEVLQRAHGHARTTTAGFPGELHVHMIINRLLMINKPCRSESVFVEWLTACLDAPAAEVERTSA